MPNLCMYIGGVKIDCVEIDIDYDKLELYTLKDKEKYHLSICDKLRQNNIERLSLINLYPNYIIEGVPSKVNELDYVAE